MTDAYAYEGFGSIVNRTGTTPNDFLFTGEQWEPGLGMYYLRARYYDPATGRFIRIDPWQRPQLFTRSSGLYLYCHNDPVNEIDPSGLFTLSELMSTLKIYGDLALHYIKLGYDVLSWREKAIFWVMVGTVSVGAISGGLQLAQKVKLVVWDFPLEKRTIGRYPDMQIAYEWKTSIEVRFNYKQLRLRIKYNLKDKNFKGAGGVNIPLWPPKGQADVFKIDLIVRANYNLTADDGEVGIGLEFSLSLPGSIGFWKPTLKYEA